MRVLLLALALATPEDNNVVREVTVDGLVAVAAEVALDGVETRAGEPLDPEAVTRDLKKLWDTRLFQDVRVTKDELGNGWRVVFVVRERSLVRRVVLGGNDELDDEVLLAQIRSTPFREPIGDEAARADAQRLIDHYRAQGFTRAEVVARIAPVAGAPGQADLLFDIHEGPRALVVELTMDGNDAVPAEVIFEVTETCEASLMNRLLRGCYYQEAALEVDLLRIQALYYDVGYVNVQVATPKIELSEDGTEASIHIPVEEGVVFRFGRVEFTVENVPPVFPVEKLQRLLGVESGEPFNRTRLFRGIERIQSAYRYEIQTIVGITPVSDVDNDAGIVNLTFLIEAPEPRRTAPGQLVPEPWKPL